VTGAGQANNKVNVKRVMRLLAAPRVRAVTAANP
jgi:hypothetical protein